MPAPLEFWFDFASTYSYVAAMRIEGMCAAAGVPLRWKAFLLGPLFELQGWKDSPFNLNALRGAYMWRDLERLTAKFGLPWRKPSEFPRRSTTAARIAAANADKPWIGDFVRAVFTANFGTDRDIGDEQVLASILQDTGQPGSILTEANEEPQRSRLRANTQEAMRAQMFGAPNCLVAGELFWGEEALEDAIDWAKRAP